MKAAMKKRQLDRSAKNILESKSTGEISDVFSDANKAKLAGFYTTNCHQGFAKFILKEKKNGFLLLFHDLAGLFTPSEHEEKKK